MFGCLITGFLVLLLFALLPFWLWPLLVVGLVVLFVLAAVTGLMKSILGAIFGRR